MELLAAARLRRANLGLDLPDPLLKPVLDLSHRLAFAEMSGLIEMLKIRSQFQQEFLGKAMTHNRVYSPRGATKTQDNRLWNSCEVHSLHEPLGAKNNLCLIEYQRIFSTAHPPRDPQAGSTPIQPQSKSSRANPEDAPAAAAISG